MRQFNDIRDVLELATSSFSSFVEMTESEIPRMSILRKIEKELSTLGNSVHLDSFISVETFISNHQEISTQRTENISDAIREGNMAISHINNLIIELESLGGYHIFADYLYSVCTVVMCTMHKLAFNL